MDRASWGAGVAVTDVLRRFWLDQGSHRIPYGLGAAMLRRPDDEVVLGEAYQLGFRYFDTSLYYGESEVVVGRFVSGVQRASVFVATKTDALDKVAGRTSKEVRTFVRDCCERSLERLGVDQVDLYQLHEINSIDPYCRQAAADELHARRASGQCKYVGATGRSLDVLLEATTSGLYDTVLTYSDYTAISQDAANVLATGSASRVAMINGSPLVGGLISDADPRRSPVASRAPGELVARAGEFHDLCAAWGVSPLAVALQFPLNNPQIAITLTGPASVDEVRSSVRSLGLRIQPSVWTALTDWNAGNGGQHRTEG